MNAALTRLSRDARAACKWRGHDMRPFHPIPYWANVRTSECRKCGMQVAIDADPAPNGIDIGGEAVALDCGSPSRF
jgi:hypothetical protein